ncbi:MAG: GTPase HflX [Anaerovoracaceae bacterium]
MAQLQYRMPRLMGFGKSLSRLGGGIGTRGPGEKKLETDRRHITRRMDDIKAELAQNKVTRGVQRAKREKSGIPIVALVGYTNAGKSALMNRILTMADKEEKMVGSKDMLFATLDTQQRKIKLSTNHEFILIDTVGFVSKLPHSLVQAFKATLEEVTCADLLLEVVDASYLDHDFQIEVTEKVLKEIGGGDKEKIVLYNKIDQVETRDFLETTQEESMLISAKTGEGLEELVSRIEEKIFSDRVTVTLLIPYNRGDVVSYVCEKGIVKTMDHTGEGTKIQVELPLVEYDRVKNYDTI